MLALTVAVGAVAVTGIGVAFAGIQGSKHDLGTGGTSQFGSTGGGSGEVCVFCHTPHGSDTSASVPLWNRTLPTATYTRYSALNTSTLDGTEAPVGSVSLACLSCHDGTQAMDVMINAPGSGAGTPPAGTKMTGSGAFPMLGTDLSNDHPISIQYAGGGLTSADADGAYTNTKFKDKDFNAVYKSTINSVPVWWVDGNSDGIRQKTEMMLYTRTLSGTTQPFVECASCHDPHNASTASTTAGAQQVAFLRTSNTHSEVCLSCHNK
ncbi:MAG: hypothetical protein HQL64_03680 [Magnetococcales bacterium]|nr:hypothetical protein [Magnetococcales bacterium]